MKRLLLAAVLLALMVGGAWAQDWTSTTSSDGDSVFIVTSVKMVGLQWSLDGIGAGADDAVASGALTFSVGHDTLYAAYPDGDLAHPCDTMEIVYILENTGGVTMDVSFAALDIDTCTSPDKWSYSNAGFSHCGGENTYTMGYDDEFADNFQANAISHDVSPTDWTSDAGTFAEIPDDATHIVAEDPNDIGDGAGNYHDGEDDCGEFHWYIRVPSSATEATKTHVIGASLNAKIAD